MSTITARQKLTRALIHIPVGVFNVYCGYIAPVYALIFCLGFLCYEVVQDWRIKDRGFHDIYGWLIGIAIGVVGLGIVRFWGGG